jgi:hypothetical protein
VLPIDANKPVWRNVVTVIATLEEELQEAPPSLRPYGITATLASEARVHLALLHDDHQARDSAVATRIRSTKALGRIEAEIVDALVTYQKMLDAARLRLNVDLPPLPDQHVRQWLAAGAPTEEELPDEPGGDAPVDTTGAT